MVMRVTLLCLFWFLAAGVQAAEILARVERNPVALNESFQLILKVEGEPDADPDLSVLEAQFDILSRNQSSSLQIINGQVRRSQQWELTLMARKAGNYVIPAIAFGADRSNALELTVKPEPEGETASGGPVFLEVSLDGDQAYPQQQLVYTVRLLRSVPLRSATLSEPRVTGVEARLEKLGEDDSFETRRGGERYQVVERRYAVFPQGAGTLTLEPIVFQGQIVESSRYSLQDRLNVKRLRSEALSLPVQERPPAAPQPWLPARALRLQEEWSEDRPQFAVGEPVTRTLTLMAAGIPAAQLPELPKASQPGLKIYADQPLVRDQIQADGILGVRQEKQALLPTAPGRYELPAVEILWWNLDTDRPETVRLPARTIEVAPAPGTSGQAPPSTRAPAASPAPRAFSPPPAAAPAVGPGPWPWISLGLGLGWLLTLGMWWRMGGGRRMPSAPRASAPTPPKPRRAARAVMAACRQGNAPACKQALLHWARGQWPEDPPNSLGDIAARSPQPLAQALHTLHQALYARAARPWQGDELLQAFRTAQGRETRAAAAPVEPLPPLHPAAPD
jgi:hypothetical protein